MTVVKIGGKVKGAKLTAAERKALEIECRKFYADWDRKNIKELDSIILWALREEFGFGRRRMRRIYRRANRGFRELIAKYEMEDLPEEKVWLCTHKLKEYGVDLDEWEKEEEREQRKGSQV